MGAEKPVIVKKVSLSKVPGAFLIIAARSVHTSAALGFHLSYGGSLAKMGYHLCRVAVFIYQCDMQSSQGVLHPKLAHGGYHQNRTGLLTGPSGIR